MILIVVIIKIIINEGVDYLRSHVLKTPHRSAKAWSGQLVDRVGAEVKIAQFNILRLSLADTENIIGFEVTVRNAAAMKERERLGEVTHNFTGLGLSEVSSALDVLKKGTSMQLLKDQVEFIILFKVFNELNDIFLPAAHVIDFNLLQ